jgi:hypothetical protein
VVRHADNADIRARIEALHRLEPVMTTSKQDAVGAHRAAARCEIEAVRGTANPKFACSLVEPVTASGRAARPR